jgi:hypothetical protein
MTQERAPEVTVVYLARRASGVEAVRRFVDSYLKLEAGTGHELHVICKGFDRDDEVRGPFERTGRSFRVHRLTDDGVDIGAYLSAAREVTTELVCFLNSFSEIRAEGWLQKLVAATREAGVGLAGATGSFESSLIGIAQRVRRDWRALIRSPGSAVATVSEIVRGVATYPIHPNPHLRTNAFVVRTSVFRGLHLGGADKRAALEFESGYRSMTRQLAARGLEAVVVGADGRSFRPQDWPASETFRYLEQRNLLVHDNQTRRYQAADGDERRFLGRLAWGSRYQG